MTSLEYDAYHHVIDTVSGTLSQFAHFKYVEETSSNSNYIATTVDETCPQVGRRAIEIDRAVKPDVVTGELTSASGIVLM